VALSLHFVDTDTAAEVEKAVTRIERLIKTAHPEVTRVFVEAQARDAHRNSQEPLETLPDEDNICERPRISDTSCPQQQISDRFRNKRGLPIRRLRLQLPQQLLCWLTRSYNTSYGYRIY
jgi:hypothetical protein